MKRLLGIALVALVATAGFAQTTGLESVQSDTSFGIFGNELDAALTVQEAGNRPGFSELTNRMIFGGLSNLNFAAGQLILLPLRNGNFCIAASNTVPQVLNKLQPLRNR
jgi:hypothetical protein